MSEQNQRVGEQTEDDLYIHFQVQVRMPPLREWSARVKVKSVEKAKPSFDEGSFNCLYLDVDDE